VSDPNQPFIARTRMKFTKQGAIRFLSHLDLLRCVERALRRSGLPVAYTEGFHPRMRISFGPALALGHASRSEWMDVDMTAEVGEEELLDRLNGALPEGLAVLSARVVPSAARALQAAVERACYRVELDPATSMETLEAAVGDLMRQQEIPLVKKNKALNLRAFIDEVRVESSPPTLSMTLRVGQQGSVRPEDVLAALSAKADPVFIERVALLTASGQGAWAEP
jgi:radical SAM-linked protein